MVKIKEQLAKQKIKIQNAMRLAKRTIGKGKDHFFDCMLGVVILAYVGLIIMYFNNGIKRFDMVLYILVGWLVYRLLWLYKRLF